MKNKTTKKDAAARNLADDGSLTKNQKKYVAYEKQRTKDYNKAMKHLQVFFEKHNNTIGGVNVFKYGEYAWGISFMYDVEKTKTQSSIE